MRRRSRLSHALPHVSCLLLCLSCALHLRFARHVFTTGVLPVSRFAASHRWLLAPPGIANVVGVGPCARGLPSAICRLPQLPFPGRCLIDRQGTKLCRTLAGHYKFATGSQGYGRMAYADGSWYEGNWHQGGKHGYGYMWWSTTNEAHQGRSWSCSLLTHCPGGKKGAAGTRIRMLCLKVPAESACPWGRRAALTCRRRPRRCGRQVRSVARARMLGAWCG